ncbi:SidE phosphodiesterase domain-containing protein [Legionella sainthelensi]|uniref:SidE PDE domain-containing protein n=1 Tax=Legionella sainthelensi TaxID=28087 RepID=A0A2H5FNZ4_9GAMM|nr:SidE phosphodiesterase domain-containing protein [Legionella sainthelensi]AUH73220.1 hypothetical protein CAB17_15045 [Legionella sainthelensi]
MPKYVRKTATNVPSNSPFPVQKSRYESKKPSYQTKQNHSQPPMDSLAVFEWETFAALTDFSDNSLAEVYKRISRDIIERPYHYDPHKVFNAQGKKIDKYPFSKANNTEPPEKIPGVAVYKQNHGTGHALRQMIYTDAIINKMAVDGNSKGRAIAQAINSNPEIKSALKLAAYCKRIGRTLDHEKDNRGPATIYSKRSADIFEQIAKELGFNHNLIQIIKEGMLEHTLNKKHTLDSYQDVAGINGKALRYFTENVLMSAHRIDLTRIFSVRRGALENSLQYYFDNSQLKEVVNNLVEMGCKANAMTGNKVAHQEAGVNYTYKPSLDGKKLVEVVTNIDQAITELSHLQLATSNPVINLDNPISPSQPSETKHVFAFDIDDTLIKQHSFKDKNGPLFKQKEMSKIKAKMVEAISNGHEVWIVTANWKYKKEDMKKLFAQDSDDLLGKINFYNGIDIGQELNIPHDRLHTIHSEGKKAEFLSKVIMKNDDLKNYKVNCVLFDDTQSQIDKCVAYCSDNINIEGYRVDDYKALRQERPWPKKLLSDVFAKKVSNALATQPGLNPQICVPMNQPPVPLIKDYSLGHGHKVIGITVNTKPEGGFIVHGKNSNGDDRFIQVHANGSIRNYQGKRIIKGYVAQKMKAEASEIFRHFNVILPVAVENKNGYKASDGKNIHFFSSAIPTQQVKKLDHSMESTLQTQCF